MTVIYDNNNNNNNIMYISIQECLGLTLLEDKNVIVKHLHLCLGLAIYTHLHDEYRYNVLVVIFGKY